MSAQVRAKEKKKGKEMICEDKKKRIKKSNIHIRRQLDKIALVCLEIKRI